MCFQVKKFESVFQKRLETLTWKKMGTGDGVADAANLAGSMAKDIYLESGLSRHGSDYSAASGGGGHLRRGGRRRERVRLQETNPHSADETDQDPGQERDFSRNLVEVVPRWLIDLMPENNSMYPE